MKYTSVEHEAKFNKLYDGLRDDEMIPTPSKASAPIDTGMYLNEVRTYIQVMLQSQENYAYSHLTSHNKIFGPLLVFTKKVIRKLIKWYIDPISLQQTAYNNAVTSAIDRTTELVTELINKTNEMENLYYSSFKELEIKGAQYEEMKLQMDHTQAQYEEMKLQMDHTQAQYEEMKLQMDHTHTQYDPLSLKVEQLQHHMDEKIGSLEKNHNIYSESIDKAVTKLKKLEEIEIFKENEFDIFNKYTFSQSGEDSILAYIVIVLGIPFESIDYIDMGANHAKEMSNTYFFYSRGAKGILVEANPDLIPELKFYRHRDIILNNCVDVEMGKEVDFYILNGDGLSTPDINAANEFCKTNPDLKIVDKKVVRTISYKTIVEQYLGKAPTILSIDIEGKDLEILRSIDYEKYRPLLIVIEMISYDIILNYNTKNEEIKNFLNSKGYDEYAFTGINSIFLDRNYLKKVKEGDI